MPIPDPTPASAAATSEGPRRLALVINALGFQAGWFACVLGAAHGWPWLGTGVAFGLLIGHLATVARPAQEAKLAASVLLIGLVFDAAMLGLGLVSYPNGGWGPGFGPHWMAALWLLLALTLNVSMRWLRRRLGLAALLGAIAGPLSYGAGVRLGAATLVEPTAAMAFLAIGWGVLMPFLMVLAQRFDGVTPRPKMVLGAPRPTVE